METRPRPGHLPRSSARRTFASLGALTLAAIAISGCRPTATANNTVATENNKRVVLYCSVDDVYAKPLVAALEKRTGLQIDTLYDTEATKTAGLTNRIRAERDRPRADVFWSSALLQTLLLSEDGLLEKYVSPAAKDVPAQYKSAEGAWTAVGLRGRVQVIHNRSHFKFGDKTQESSYLDLFGKTYGSTIKLISNPQFGTASDWVAAIVTRDGLPQTLTYFREMKANNVRVLGGNGDVARQVADNVGLSGVTDTDDVLAQARRTKIPIGAVKITWQKPITYAREPILIPGSVSLVKGGPNPENAKKLLDAIVSKENEAALVKEMPGVFSTRGFNRADNWKSGGIDFHFFQKPIKDDYSKWPDAWRKVRDPLAKIFIGEGG